MITRNKGNWFRMLLVWRGSVLPQILPQLLALLLLSIAVVYFRGVLFDYKIPLNPAPFTLLGLALAIFLGFRNNVSYDRYWEARKLWGSLLNETRSLTRQALSLTGLPTGSDQVAYFTYLLIAFTYALKHQLRHSPPEQDMSRLLPPALADRLRPLRFKPVWLMAEMGLWLRQLKSQGYIDTIIQARFDQNLDQLSNIVGGCERIASTPIPFTYHVLLHRTVYLYCFLLPFGLVDTIGWMTPLIVVFVGYTFLALDAIVSEIEDPFGDRPNDLALNAMSQGIEATLLEMLGKPPSASPGQTDRFMID